MVTQCRGCGEGHVIVCFEMVNFMCYERLSKKRVYPMDYYTSGWCLRVPPCRDPSGHQNPSAAGWTLGTTRERERGWWRESKKALAKISRSMIAFLMIIILLCRPCTSSAVGLARPRSPGAFSSAESESTPGKIGGREDRSATQKNAPHAAVPVHTPRRHLPPNPGNCIAGWQPRAQPPCPKPEGGRGTWTSCG